MLICDKIKVHLLFWIITITITNNNTHFFVEKIEETLIGVPRNFHIYFSVSRLKKLEKHWFKLSSFSD